MRLFVNRLLVPLRGLQQATVVSIANEPLRDLAWLSIHLPKHNGIKMLEDPPASEQIEVDACLQGIGGRYRDKVFFKEITSRDDALRIHHWEMIAAVVAIKLWAPSMQDKSVLLLSDNTAAYPS